MKKVAFASGKGGAGKTTLSMSFHKFLGNDSVFADCDVDAADAFLIIEEKKLNSLPFISGYKYEIDPKLCIKCRKCLSSCKFGAIRENGSIFIESMSCEGCGVCQDICEACAITKNPNHCGNLFISRTNFSTTMTYARLSPGEDNSGKLSHQVRNASDLIMDMENKQYVVVDCPPGIGCPLMASLTGIDLLVVIIESSLSGFSDAKRLVEVARKIGLKTIAVLNKAGLDSAIDYGIRDYLHKTDILLAGVIPFDEKATVLLSNKQLLIDHEPFKENLEIIFANICQYAQKESS
jgi:MinD superfamily P-loop ATPase